MAERRGFSLSLTCCQVPAGLVSDLQEDTFCLHTNNSLQIQKGCFYKMSLSCS